MSETIAFLGCSRGLGQAVVEKWHQARPDDQLILVGRRRDTLAKLKESLLAPAEILVSDLTKEDDMRNLLTSLHLLQPTRLFYFAGGGCFGPYGEKQWKDHMWGLQLNLLTPAHILHACLHKEPTIAQMVFVGSKVADEGGDLHSASYAAGKSGLRGLIESIQAEGLPVDLRLFRPGYMDTTILPPNAWPRSQEGLVASPASVAQLFLDWVLDPQGASILTP